MTAGTTPAFSGLPLEQAFKRWGDPKIYVTWLAHEDARQPVAMAPGVPPNEKVLRHNIYAEAREALEEQLRALLLAGKILASGVADGSDGRSVIKPSLWKLADFSPDFDYVFANGLTYTEVEYFPASKVPANVEEWPDWLTKHVERMVGQLPPILDHSPDYRHIRLGERVFVLGELQAKVVRLLHLAEQEGNPWCSGKALLHDIGSRSANIGTLFKQKSDWRSLIESDKHGNYRLRRSMTGK